MSDSYVYYTRSAFTTPQSHGAPLEQTPTGPADVCESKAAFPVRGDPPRSPFDQSLPAVECFSARTPKLRYAYGEPPPGEVASSIRLQFPLLLSAVDPVQEARLVGLDKTVVRGRYLRPMEALARPRGGFQGHAQTIPVIADSSTYLDRTLRTSVQRLDVGETAQLPNLLASAKMPNYVKHLTGPVVSTSSRTAARDYLAVLRQYTQNSRQDSFGDFSEYRQAGPIRYAEQRGGALAPVPVRNPLSVWLSKFYDGYAPVPLANADVGFRRLSDVKGTNTNNPDNTLVLPTPRIVGQFDPAKLPGFSPLSRVPLETYFPPQVTGADPRSRAALHDQPLLPDANLAGYLAQPPALLTTLTAARASFFNPSLYTGASSAPISYIRVRVAGVSGPDKTGLARLDAVATEIHKSTGLLVDITDGSSPAPQKIALPAGRFGRPALTVTEAGSTRASRSGSWARSTARACCCSSCCWPCAGSSWPTPPSPPNAPGAPTSGSWPAWAGHDASWSGSSSPNKP